MVDIVKVLEDHKLWLLDKTGIRANLRGANLRGADLRGADLRGADLPAPTSLLLCRWGMVSKNLCIEAMLFDANNHPNPESFDIWKKDGVCPYDDCKWQRCVNFQESRELWPGWDSNRKIMSALELAEALIAEKCK